MLTAKAKRGRPTAVHKMANGTRVVGLMRLSDGRWRASGPEKFTFTEKDEGRAVARFYEWQASKSGATLSIPRAAARLNDEQGLRRAIGSLPRPKPTGEPPKGTFLPPDASGPLVVSDQHPIPVKVPQPIRVQLNGDRIEFIDVPTMADAFWPWLADFILTQKEYIAKMTGIEKLAWLDLAEKPKPSPTLTEVGKAYFGRNDLSEKECQKVEATWEHFRRSVGVTTLRELTPEIVATWGQKVKKDGLSPKTQRHYYNRVKTVLNHFRTTGRAIEDTRRAIDCCGVLKSPATTSLDPHPIGREDFAKLLAAATEGEEKAVLLVGLNLCFYPIDLARVRWGEIDLERGVYHAKRGKTKVARCGVLWPRTIEALKAVSRSDMDDYVFHKENGHPHTDTTVRKWFFKLRERAKVSTDVQFADIRDGAFTEAVAGEGVEFQHAQILAGHRSGIADAYVLRNPRMVTVYPLPSIRHADST